MDESMSSTGGSQAASAQDDDLEARARRAREAWLAGPTEEEMIAWARQERMRRIAEAEQGTMGAGTGASMGGTGSTTAEDAERMARRYGREAQLAVEGAIYLLFTGPTRLFSTLVQTGREFEAGATRVGPRRRVSMYDEEF